MSAQDGRQADWLIAAESGRMRNDRFRAIGCESGRSTKTRERRNTARYANASSVKPGPGKPMFAPETIDVSFICGVEYLRRQRG